MTHNQGKPGVTPLSELFTRYLQGQAVAQAEGLGYAESEGEVEPYDVAPVQPVDPQLAWREALAAALHLAPATKTWPVPPEWPSLVAAQEPAFAPAFCLGNFPQLVRDLAPLLRGSDLTTLYPKPAQPQEAPALRTWAAQSGEAPRLLLAAGALRLAGHFDEAAALLERVTDGAWQAARDNEKAALAWHRGKAEQALALWQAQAESVPVLFNRGMALLFLGRAVEARSPLARAVQQLPEGGSWHHLGRLYLTLTEARA
jgi:tetratricopeptide (TPR) repeat protein